MTTIGEIRNEQTRFAFDHKQAPRYDSVVNRKKSGPCNLGYGGLTVHRPTNKTLAPLDWASLATQAWKPDKHRPDEKPPVLHFASSNGSVIAAADGFRLHITPTTQQVGIYSIKKNSSVPFDHPSKYPDYNQIIPKKFSVTAQISQFALWYAIQVCSVYAREWANIVKLTVYPDSLILQAQSAETGDSTCALCHGDKITTKWPKYPKPAIEKTITVKSDAPETGFVIGVNVRYLAEAISRWAPDEVLTIKFSTQSSPLLITAGDKTTFAVVMPMHLSGETDQPATRPTIQAQGQPAKSETENKESNVNGIPYTNYVEWKEAKPGDALVDGRILVKRHIRTKRAAHALADEVGGTIALDGPRAWAVIRNPDTTPTEPQPIVEPPAPVQPQPDPQAVALVEPALTALPDWPPPAQVKLPKSPQQAIAVLVQIGSDWADAHCLAYAQECFKRATDLAAQADTRKTPDTHYHLVINDDKTWRIEARAG